ncbi:MAG: transcriptional repressor [Candidatus Saccharibacteria bacterium]|nr:transcriptional repressor [Candidatus Saccharibacteria bacterium]
MASATLQLIDTLRQHGYSNTRVRRMVFELVQQHDRLTPTEIYTALSDHIDRASVYRTIDLFEQLGIIQRLYSGWKYVLELSDNYSDHHHHISCQTCHKVVTLTAKQQLEDAIHSLAQSAGFSATGHQLEIRGICLDCQQGQSTSYQT